MSQPPHFRPEKTPQWRKMRAFGRRLEVNGYLEPEERTHIKRIVVIGGQSAGKSALVSMLTGVKLESSTKATTRGPTVFRFIKGNDKQSYQIWPEFVEDAEGKALSEMIRGEVDYCRAEDLPVKIKCLHRLVLRPEFDAGDYIDSEEIPTTQRLADIDPSFFTKNRVVIEKSGTDMPNLEIVDLPGLQVSSDHPEMLRKIKAMTEENLKATSHTFAIGICPATSEPESQEVPTIIKNWDPSMAKTIIALSRADEMTGDECAWQDMMLCYKDSFCFVASSVPSGLLENSSSLQASEKQTLENMRLSRTNYMHKVPNLLSMGNLVRLMLKKCPTRTNLGKLQTLFNKLEAELDTLVVQQNEHQRDEIIGEINAHVDLAAEQLRTAIIAFEQSSDLIRDRRCTALSTRLKACVDKAELQQSQVFASEAVFTDVIIQIHQGWKALVDSHQEQVWAGVLSHIETSIPRSLPQLSHKIRQAVASIISTNQILCKDFVDSLCAQYSGHLDVIRYDAAADAYYDREFLTATEDAPATFTGLLTPPVTPPKRSGDVLVSGRQPRNRDLRVSLQQDLAVEQARQTKLYVDASLQRLVVGVQDRLSHSIACVAGRYTSNLSHLIRDKVGTNKVLILKAAEAIMAASPEEVAERNEKMVKLNELIAIGKQALGED